MREIEKAMVNAVNSQKNFRQSNTEVEIRDNVILVYLHGNCICKIDRKTGKRFFKNCGFSTMTTRSRLNALGANVRIKNGCMVFIESGEYVPAYNF